MKLYTGAGDRGETSVIGGGKVSKAAPVIGALGALDEANAYLGLVRSYLDDRVRADLEEMLISCQRDLFTLGAGLAGAKGNELDVGRIADLEEAIDRMVEETPPLTQFVLPGGDRAACYLHVARTVTRRAERDLAAAFGEAKLDPSALTYINRLSDFLFAAARYVNARSDVDETTWPGA